MKLEPNKSFLAYVVSVRYFGHSYRKVTNTILNVEKCNSVQSSKTIKLKLAWNDLIENALTSQIS
jgi:hypothetical protein